MHPIICKNEAELIVKQIREYILKGGEIKDIHLVDDSDSQVVLVVSDHKITAERASDWWSGYTAGLKQALE
jgi:hypothetical protein